MQTRMRQLTLGMGLILAAGCAGQQVATDYSPATSFSQFRTFALVAPPDSAPQELIDARVRNAVEVELTGKGLTETDRADADLFVGYGVVNHTHKQVYTTGSPWGWGGGWGWRYYRWGVAWPETMQRRVETYTEGTVVVSLVDAKTKRVVWRGEAADVLRLPVGNPAQAAHRINQAVETLFAKYPPQSSGA